MAQDKSLPDSDVVRNLAEAVRAATLNGAVEPRTGIDLTADRAGAGNAAVPSPVAARPEGVKIASVAEIGALVRDARRRQGLTQQRFADLAGVGRRFVSELETGKPTLEAGRVLQCCATAGIDLFARPRAA